MTPVRSPHPLASALAAALDRGDSRGLGRLADDDPADRRDRFLTLLTCYDLHTAPLAQVGAAARFQHHPALAALRGRLEDDWLRELDRAWMRAGPLQEAGEPGRLVPALRAVAARDRLPPAYRWLSREASRAQLAWFLALEGGPDGGFDDLVATCQVGLSGGPKVELARNYWDEMGNGRPERVHSVLHERVRDALELPVVPLAEQPVSALERAALTGMLATHRWLQPELLGALGLTELQAGPRCRLVLQAFDRLGVPAEAYPFYTEHAEVDPRHGRDWVDNALVPLVAQHPQWASRIVRGAWWRATVNAAFFAELGAWAARRPEGRAA